MCQLLFRLVQDGNSTVDFQKTFEGALKHISFHLDSDSRLEYPVQPGPTQDVLLPCVLPKFDVLGPYGSPYMNNRVQEIMGRATGVLGEEETWAEFLRRPNIVPTLDWKEFHRISQEEPDKIPGVQYRLPVKAEQVIQYGGIPYYLLTDSKYPGVRAVVQFKTIGHNPTPLDELFAQDRTTVHVTLKVPTSEFIPPQVAAAA